jgi:hypothetical protein
MTRGSDNNIVVKIRWSDAADAMQTLSSVTAEKSGLAQVILFWKPQIGLTNGYSGRTQRLANRRYFNDLAQNSHRHDCLFASPVIKSCRVASLSCSRKNA